MIRRKLQERIEPWLFRGKAIVLYWPRQVGKTTLSKALLATYGNPKDYFDCDNLEAYLGSVFKEVDRENCTDFLMGSA